MKQLFMVNFLIWYTFLDYKVKSQGVSSDIYTVVESVLQTVNEEPEGDLRERSFDPKTLTVLSSIGTMEDEVSSVLTQMFTDFVVKGIPQKSLGKTTYEEIRPIINCFAVGMGFEETPIDNEWNRPKRLSMTEFR